ncbi:MAG: 6-phosphogluconolactonase [Acidobacteriota bacterium]|nr:6-phosphogluconolactonase [Acidobacteriota bacterium]
MSARWHVYADPESAAEACAQHIFTLLDEVLAGKDHATLAVSGGSTPKLLFDHLVAHPFHWDRVHIFFVDERAVPPTDPESNYKLANEHLVIPAKIPARNVHRITTEHTPDHSAASYTREIQSFFGLGEGEPPHFDVIHQGMGSDAHTASLFPGEPLIQDREGIAAATYKAEDSQWRITLLPGVLLAAKHTVFLVTGKDKREAVKNVFEGEYEPLKYPAQIVAHHGRRVAWFLDRAAAPAG